MLHALFILIATVGVQDEAPTPAASSADIARLVEQLGDKKFRVRQQATAKLKSLGGKAVPSLRKAVTNPNSEISDRATSVLGYVLGTAARLKFLKEPSVANAKQVKAWSRLRKLVVSDEAAIAQLKSWLEAEPRIFEAGVMGGDVLTNELRDRASRLSDYKRRPPEINAVEEARVLASVSAIVFVATDPQVGLTRVGQSAVESVFKLGVTRRALAPAVGNNAVMRTLAGVWIGQPGSQYTKLQLCLDFGLPEGLAMAESIVRSKARGPRMEYALHLIGKLGGKKQVKLLQSQLSNDVRLSRRQVRAVQRDGRPSKSNYEYQVRDIALAMLWHLHEEDPAKHGFDSNRVRRHPRFVFAQKTLGFSSDADREAAFAEWNEFAKKTGI
ncbi:MAG: hypothetical protein AB8G99_20445 [Planctomycetaceae bacterium]